MKVFRVSMVEILPELVKNGKQLQLRRHIILLCDPFFVRPPKYAKMLWYFLFCFLEHKGAIGRKQLKEINVDWLHNILKLNSEKLTFHRELALKALIDHAIEVEIQGNPLYIVTFLMLEI